MINIVCVLELLRFQFIRIHNVMTSVDGLYNFKSIYIFVLVIGNKTKWLFVHLSNRFTWELTCSSFMRKIMVHKLNLDIPLNDYTCANISIVMWRCIFKYIIILLLKWCWCRFNQTCVFWLSSLYEGKTNYCSLHFLASITTDSVIVNKYNI